MARSGGHNALEKKNSLDPSGNRTMNSLLVVQPVD